MDAFLYRLKAAQFDLIEACGGIERAGEKANASKTVVGRWKDRNDPSLMTIPAVIALEADCGRAFVTAVMAGVNGRRVTDPDEERGAQADFMASNAAVMQAVGAYVADVAAAISDGNISPTEAHVIDRSASQIETAIAGVRQGSAVIKAHGGARAGLRVVREG